MKAIFLDAEYRCHATDDGTMIRLETDTFDGKCDTYIEGYRYIPAGESWTRSDGKVFTGVMISPWKPYAELLAAQRQYERDLADLEAAYQEGVNSV
jgi:hypothetical protein